MTTQQHKVTKPEMTITVTRKEEGRGGAGWVEESIYIKKLPNHIGI
jgi:hypothetical protein